MTMPHLMNCSHSDDSWCLDCVKQLYDEDQAKIKRLQGIKAAAEIVVRQTTAVVAYAAHDRLIEALEAAEVGGDNGNG